MEKKIFEWYFSSFFCEFEVILNLTNFTFSKNHANKPFNVNKFYFKIPTGNENYQNSNFRDFYSFEALK